MQKFKLNHLSKLPLVLTALGLLSVMTFFFTQSCKEIEEVNGNSIGSIKSAYSPLGVTNVGGVLHFVDRAKLEEVYDSLFNNQITGFNPAVHDSICIGGTFPYLDSFEMNLNFTSLRRQYEVINCAELDAGVEPKDLSNSHVFDDVLASLISPDFKIKIADTLFYWRGGDQLFYSNAINAEERFNLIDNGLTMYEAGVDNSLSMKYKKGGCDVSFDYTIDLQNKKIFVNYNQDVDPNRRVSWSINGVKGLHIDENSFNVPITTEGLYTICINVSNTMGTPEEEDDCNDEDCKEIPIKFDCTATFEFEYGPNGFVTFINKSVVNPGIITGYSWSFAGLGTSTDQNPTFTFPDDCSYPVTLTIYSTTCPSGQKAEIKNVTITSGLCCGYKSNDKQDAPYNNDNNILSCSYDLGTDYFWDQRFEAKQANYVRKGNKWKAQSFFSQKIDFHDDLYKKDQDNCNCKLTQPISPDPNTALYNCKKIVVRDKLSGIKWNPDKNTEWYKIRRLDPIFVDYYLGDYNNPGSFFNMLTLDTKDGFDCN